MRADEFFLLINEIDPALVLEAEGNESPPEKAAAKRAFPFGGMIAAAALITIMAAIVAGIFIIIGIRMNGIPEPNTPGNSAVAANSESVSSSSSTSDFSSSSSSSSSSNSSSTTSKADVSTEPAELPMFFKDPQPEDIVYDVEHNVSYVKNQLLISAELGAPELELRQIFEELDAEIVGYIGLTNDYQIEFRTDKTLAELEAAADHLDSFAFVQGVTLNLVYEINYDVED